LLSRSPSRLEVALLQHALRNLKYESSLQLHCQALKQRRQPSGCLRCFSDIQPIGLAILNNSFAFITNLSKIKWMQMSNNIFVFFLDKHVGCKKTAPKTETCFQQINP
jgi:hypothetical protein